jgi:hypothetical protein
MVFEPGVLEVTGTELTLDQHGTPFPGAVETTDDGLVLRFSR